ncbi:DUF1963 domain-containing protein [Promicromonospora kroppenstedtii]|uniref:DUF1963 domain-containing protein n=1 Tax=Promicromonospora kroppenstedtii TaxID=440482 RepID=A0ABW7XHU2_9MICO
MTGHGGQTTEGRQGYPPVPSPTCLEVQWVLLFQVDSYDGALWGDVGTLYWLARTKDLARGDLSNPRFVMQCC